MLFKGPRVCSVRGGRWLRLVMLLVWQFEFYFVLIWVSRLNGWTSESRPGLKLIVFFFLLQEKPGCIAMIEMWLLLQDISLSLSHSDAKARIKCSKVSRTGTCSCLLALSSCKTYQLNSTLQMKYATPGQQLPLSPDNSCQMLQKLRVHSIPFLFTSSTTCSCPDKVRTVACSL